MTCMVLLKAVDSASSAAWIESDKPTLKSLRGIANLGGR